MGDDFGFGRVGLEAVGGENGAVVRSALIARVQNSLNFRALCFMSVAIMGILYQILREMAFA